MPTEEQTYREGVMRMLTAIETQTTKTNGRVNRLEIYMIVVASVVSTLLLVNSSALLDFLMKIVV